MGALEPRSYRRTPPRGRALALAVAVACAACSGRVIERSVRVTLSDATSCRPPSGVERVRLRALGDAPSIGAAAIELGPDRAALPLPEASFPVLAIAATGEGPGFHALGYRDRASRGDEMLLLPPSLSCGLADPEARAPEGAAIAVGPDGALVVAGGLGDDGIATRRVISLAPGAQRIEMRATELAAASAFASAVAIDDRLVVAGGAISAAAPPYDTYEEIDLDDPDARVVGALAERRREHAAIALGDGRVLLVGGRGATGEALASIEIVDRAARRGTLSSATLRVARVAPLLARDDRGRVWIAGGETGSTIAIERFDPESDTIEAHELALPRADALAFAPGGRLAWIAGGRTFVVLARDEPAIAEPREAGTAIDRARAIATPGGRVLVVGRERAALLDPGHGTELARATSIAPSALALLGDRSVVEIAATGASLRREDEPSPWDDPPATLIPALDAEWVLLDPTNRAGDPRPAWIAPRFEQRGSDLAALEPGARADVRSLRASRMEVSVRGSGALEVVLVPVDGPEIAIAWDDGAIAVPGCEASWASGEVLAIEPGLARSGSGACPLSSPGPYGIAVRARAPGAVLSSIAIARR